MFPYIVNTSIGKYRFIISTYSILALAAIVVTGALYIFNVEKGRKKITAHIIFLGVLLLSSLLGARIVQFLFDLWVHRGQDIPFRELIKNTGGNVTGGVLFAMITIAVYSKIDPHRIMNWQTIDTVAMAFPFGHMIGRIGCVSAGCCYGKICPDCRLTLTYPANWPIDAFTAEAIPHGPRIASPLIAVIGLFIIGVILFIILKAAKHRGQVSAFYFIMYGTFRFFQEFTRGDVRAFFGPLSGHQWFSLVEVLFGIVLLALFVKRRLAGTAGPPYLPLNGKEPTDKDVFDKE
jgi:phosphatidylglycerol---prolipoprotein diacylglyceryl transferase